MRAYSMSLDGNAWEQVDPGLKKKVVNGRNMTVTRYSFSPEGVFPHHVHDQEQITYVLAGDVRFVVDREDHSLRVGDIIVIPAGIPHRAIAGSAGAEVLSVVAPARTEGRGVEYLSARG